MVESASILLFASFVSFVAFFYMLSYIFRPLKHAALWHVSTQTLAQQYRRFTIRTIAMSVMAFCLGIMSLIPSLTPHIVSYEHGFWVQGGGTVLTFLAGFIVISTYIKQQ